MISARPVNLADERRCSSSITDEDFGILMGSNAGASLQRLILSDCAFDLISPLGFHTALGNCTSLVELRLRNIWTKFVKPLDDVVPRLKSLKILETCGDLMSPAVLSIPDLALERLIVCHSDKFTVEPLHAAVVDMRGKPQPAVKRLELITAYYREDEDLDALNLLASFKGMSFSTQIVKIVKISV